MLEAEGRDAGFDPAGRSKEVSGHRFRGADADLPGVLTENLLDRQGLRLVVEGRRCPVGVDVADVLGPGARVCQGPEHDPDGAVPVRGGRGDVIGVTRHPVAGNLGVDPRPPGQGVFQAPRGGRCPPLRP